MSDNKKGLISSDNLKVINNLADGRAMCYPVSYAFSTTLFILPTWMWDMNSEKLWHLKSSSLSFGFNCFHSIRITKSIELSDVISAAKLFC